MKTIFIFFGFLYCCDSETKELEKYLKKESQISYIACLYRLFYEIDKTLREHNIKYWIDWGSLLGAVRHKAIIPWDDDGDISIFEQDEGKLKKLKNIFAQKGIQLFSWSYLGYKVNAVIEYKGVKFHPFIDIFLRHRCEKSYNPFCDPFLDDRFRKSDIYLCKGNVNSSFYVFSNAYIKQDRPFFFLEKDLLPLKEYSLGPIKVIGPNSPKKYLDNLKKWNKELKFYNHDGRKNLGSLNKKTIKITKEIMRKIDDFTNAASMAYKKTKIISIKNWRNEDIVINDPTDISPSDGIKKKTNKIKSFLNNFINKIFSKNHVN